MDTDGDYPRLEPPDDRCTLALMLDISEVLVRHGYPQLAGTPIADSAAALHTASLTATLGG